MLSVRNQEKPALTSARLRIRAKVHLLRSMKCLGCSGKEKAYPILQCSLCTNRKFSTNLSNATVATVHKGQVRVSTPTPNGTAGEHCRSWYWAPCYSKRSSAAVTTPLVTHLLPSTWPQPANKAKVAPPLPLQKPILPSDRRCRTSILQIPFNSNVHFQLRAYEHRTRARLNQAEDNLRVLRHERDDSLRDLSAFKDQNRAWVADVNRWKAEARVCPPSPHTASCLLSPLLSVLTPQRLFSGRWCVTCGEDRSSHRALLGLPS